MLDEKFDDWIETYSGVRFSPFTSSPSDIRIADIAHSLAMQCRYGGHCKRFYSIAEHSVWVSMSVKAEFAAWGLLHDAAETYLTDLPRPLKRLLPQHDELEQVILKKISDRYGLVWPIPDEVKYIDTVLLRTESIELMQLADEWVIKDIEPLDISFKYLAPKEAELWFMERFNHLVN